MSTPSHHQRFQAEQSTLFEVGGAPPPEAKPSAPMRGRPRLRTANRDQIVFRAAPWDDLIPDDHPARLVWDDVEGLDLSPLYDRIKAVERGPGRAPIDPKILRALWLDATIDGVGSARPLDELWRTHVASQGIVGDVSINYHTRTDFRTDRVALLDDLLTPSVATLLAEGLVDWNRVAQEGIRVRARAGAASFRRRPTLEEAWAQAQEPVEALRQEAEDDPATLDRRRQAAPPRAARERTERVQAAWDRLPEWEAKKKPDQKEEARCSTTDAFATVMKMPDGGFRPAYHFPFATDTATPFIAGVAVETTGRDAGPWEPMVDQVEERSGKVPREWLVDGGFAPHDPIDAVSAPEVGCTVYAPVPTPKDPKVDRHVPKPGDSAAVAAWRQRMGTDQAKEIDKERAATAECVNALARGRGLVCVWVRGVAKVKALALWSALAPNLLCAARLRAAVVGQM